MKDSDTILDRENWENIKTLIIIVQLFILAIVSAIVANCNENFGEEEGQRKMCEEICDSELISVKENRCYCANKELR